MAKRKFDESKVKRDESGRFASARDAEYALYDLKRKSGGQLAIKVSS